MRVVLVLLAAALGCAAGRRSAPAASNRAGTVFTAGVGLVLELAPEAQRPEGRAASLSLDYTTDFAGTLHAWCASSALDPELRIDAADGTPLAADANSGGGTTAYATLAVEPGQRLRLTLSAADPAGAGRVELRLEPARETEVTRSAAEAARAALARASELRSAGATDDALALVVQAIGDALRTPGASESDALTHTLAPLGLLAARLDAPESAKHAWRAVHEIRTRELPRAHPLLARARAALDLAAHTGASVPRELALEEQIDLAFSRPLPESAVELAGKRGDLGEALFFLGGD